MYVCGRQIPTFQHDFTFSISIYFVYEINQFSQLIIILRATLFSFNKINEDRILMQMLLKVSIELSTIILKGNTSIYPIKSAEK